MNRQELVHVIFNEQERKLLNEQLVKAYKKSDKPGEILSLYKLMQLFGERPTGAKAG